MTINECGEPLPEGVASFDENGVTVFYAGDRLVVDEDDVATVTDLLSARDNAVVGRDSEDLADLGLVTLLFDPGLAPRLPEDVAFVRSAAPAVTVALATKLRPMSHIHVWPGDLAEPAHALGRPEPGPPGDGRGVTVVVLDTGIDRHDWLDGSRHPSSDDEIAAALRPGVLSPLYGHGTFAAGLVHRYAPGATIVGRRLPITGSVVDDGDLAKTLVAVAAMRPRPDIVLVPWGGYTQGNAGSPALARALTRLRKECPGTAIVAAAGNDDRHIPIFPAAKKGVVAVAALDETRRQRAVRPTRPFPPPFDHWASNHGWWVDASTYGTDVRSCFPKLSKGLVRCDGKPSEAFNGGFAKWEGTSFAAAVFAGMVARYVTPDRTAKQAVHDLLAHPGSEHLDGLGIAPDLEPPTLYATAPSGAAEA